MDFESSFIAIPAIVIIVYYLAELFKIIFANKPNINKYIPTLCGGIGMILGIICFYLFPESIKSAENAFAAAAIGLFSGLSATGVNQILKQLLKNGGSSDSDNK